MPLPSTPEPRQRRRWPWILLALFLAFAGTVGWQVFTERRAIRQLEEAGFTIKKQKSMWVLARSDWHFLFKPKAWKASLERRVVARENAPFAAQPAQLRNFDALAPALRRLNPDYIAIGYPSCPALENVDGLQGLNALQVVVILNCPSLLNLEGLKGIPHLRSLHQYDCRALQNFDHLKGLADLEELHLSGCTNLRNTDALQGLTKLQVITFRDCPALENVDALKGLAKLSRITIFRSPKLSKEAIAALKSALPNTKVQIDYWVVP